MRAEVHICTLNEGELLEQTLQSLEGQGARIVVLDSASEDNTKQIANQYADQVANVPRGKLRARDIGYRHTSADIVLSADAGDTYSDNWVDQMISPFEESYNTVAVLGKTKSKEMKWQWLEAPWTHVRRRTRIQGRNSAVRTDAYLDTGGFNLNTPNGSRLRMVTEEEVRFLRRLKKRGDVVFNPSAVCYKSQRQMILSSEASMNYISEQMRGDRF